MKNIAIAVIRMYQVISYPLGVISQNFLGVQNGCRYQPTCSEYMVQAIQKYGIVKGATLGVKRISRCHPGNKGGYDPVV